MAYQIICKYTTFSAFCPVVFLFFRPCSRNFVKTVIFPSLLSKACVSVAIFREEKDTVSAGPPYTENRVCEHYDPTPEEGVRDLNTSIFTVGSVTLAVKARKLLARAGIRSRLVKTDAAKTGNGCRYGIEFSTFDFYGVSAELRKNGISYEVYREG